MKKLPLFAAALLLLFISAGPIEAGINQRSVPAIWENLTQNANLNDAGTVIIENKSEPNAWVSFSLNKYSVHATTGLLKILRNEDELSGVLAHEIGHIKLGHYSENLKRSLLWTLIYKTIGEKKIGGIDVLGTGMMLAEAGFSREEEVEADNYGVFLAAKSGYDPWGLYNALISIKKAGFQTSPNGFSSHPPTERRLIHIKTKTEEIKRKPPNQGSD